MGLMELGLAVLGVGFEATILREHKNKNKMQVNTVLVTDSTCEVLFWSDWFHLLSERK